MTPLPSHTSLHTPHPCSQVDFKANYEQTITNIQLQEQLKVTKNYALDVTRVLKEVDILQSETAGSFVSSLHT